MCSLRKEEEEGKEKKEPILTVGTYTHPVYVTRPSMLYYICIFVHISKAIMKKARIVNKLRIFNTIEGSTGLITKVISQRSQNNNPLKAPEKIVNFIHLVDILPKFINLSDLVCTYDRRFTPSHLAQDAKR